MTKTSKTMDNPNNLATQTSLSGLSIVLFVLVLCLVCAASLSGLSIVLFVFVLCLVLPVYLDCPLFCLSSSCVLCYQFMKTNKTMYNPDKLETQDTGQRQTTQWTIQIDWQCTQDTGRGQTKQWTIQIDWQRTQDTERRQTKQWTIRPVSCVASLSGLYIVLFVFVLCLVLPVYLDCPLFCLSSSCVLCCQFIWIVHCFVCLRPVSCVPIVASLKNN
jgi:hypothetical protein